MDSYSVTVTSKGQVTIPKDLRRVRGLQPRDKVAFELVDGEVRLRRVQSPVLASYGAVRAKKRPEDFRRMRREMEEEVAARNILVRGGRVSLTPS